MSADGSKYTIPTGDGYVGVSKASGNTVKINTGTVQCVTWQSDDHVVAISDSKGVALVDKDAVDDEDEVLGEAKVEKTTVGTIVRVPPSVSREIPGFEANGDVRAYDRDEGGLLLVSTSADPMVAGGGA